MEYNKTKRGLEKAAGILTIVVSAIEILFLLIYMIVILTTKEVSSVAYNYSTHTWEYVYITVFNVAGLLLIFPIAFSIVTLIFGAKLIKSPVNPDGSVSNRTGLRITTLVFAILNGQWITTGLLIAVLCLKDFKN